MKISTFGKNLSPYNLVCLAIGFCTILNTAGKYYRQEQLYIQKRSSSRNQAITLALQNEISSLKCLNFQNYRFTTLEAKSRRLKITLKKKTSMNECQVATRNIRIRVLSDPTFTLINSDRDFKATVRLGRGLTQRSVDSKSEYATFQYIP